MVVEDEIGAPPGVTHGRQAVIDGACETVKSRRHVIVAGDVLRDRRGIVADVVSALRADGLPVIDTAASEPVTASVSPGSIVVIDQTLLTPEIEQWCTALMTQRGATVVLAAPASDLVSPMPALAQRLRAVHAVELVLEPITAAQSREIVAQACQQHEVSLAPIEVNWIVAICGGSTPLLRAIVHDYAESEEASVAVFGRRTRMIANEAMTEIPAALLPVARLVATLPGVSRRRLRRFVDAHALDLLTETSIADRLDDTVVLNQAMSLALRLATPSQLDDAAVLIATDVIESLALGTHCAEPEILIVATMLREHPDRFSHVPWVDRSRLLFVTMWLLRRVGAIDRAAFAARQLMAQPGWEQVTVLHSIARGTDEDLDALSADLRSDAFPPEAYEVAAPWLQCLSLPLTRDTAATRWALDLSDTPGASGPDPAMVAALRTVLRAAGALQEQDLQRANDLATDVLLPQGAHDATRVRALIILGATGSLAADGPRVERFVNRILNITLANSPSGLHHDLARRSLDDALMMSALMLASLGAPAPSALLDCIDDRTHAAALADDHPALIRMALTRLSVARDETNTSGTMRFLSRLSPNDLSAWVLSRFGGEPARPPMHLVSGVFMDHALTSARLLSTLAVRGPEGLARVWGTYEVSGTPFRVIGEAYLALTVRKEALEGDVTAIAELSLPKDSVLGAVRDHVVGMARKEPAVLVRALEAFVANHAWECARVVNRDLALITADDPTWSKQVKAGQRLLQSEMRSVAATQSALTPREREVTQLAAQGMRNKQIAEVLFLSVRTVESHLYRALHKLSAVRDDLDAPPARGSDSAPDSAPGSAHGSAPGLSV